MCCWCVVDWLLMDCCFVVDSCWFVVDPLLILCRRVVDWWLLLIMMMRCCCYWWWPGCCCCCRHCRRGGCHRHICYRASSSYWFLPFTVASISLRVLACRTGWDPNIPRLRIPCKASSGSAKHTENPKLGEFFVNWPWEDGMTWIVPLQGYPSKKLLHQQLMCISCFIKSSTVINIQKYVPVVPHKAVAEVSRIGNV